MSYLQQRAIRDARMRAFARKQRGFIIDPYRYGAGGGGPTDPYFSFVVSLLHMNGTDGSPTFADAFRTWTANGNAQIDTAQSQFGGASGLFDGIDDDITSPHTTDFEFPADYTVEGWARLANVTNHMHFFNTGDYATGQLSIRMNASGQLEVVDSNIVLVATSNSFTANTMTAWAVSRVGSDTYLFIGGTLGATDTGGATSYSGTGPFRIGSVWTSSQVLEVDGHLDEIRVTNGVGRYTATYTPDAAAFPDS